MPITADPERVAYYRDKRRKATLLAVSHLFQWEQAGLPGLTYCGEYLPRRRGENVPATPCPQCAAAAPVTKSHGVSLGDTIVSVSHVDRQGAQLPDMTYRAARVVLKAVHGGRHLPWDDGTPMVLGDVRLTEVGTGRSLKVGF